MNIEDSIYSGIFSLVKYNYYVAIINIITISIVLFWAMFKKQKTSSLLKVFLALIVGILFIVMPFFALNKKSELICESFGLEKHQCELKIAKNDSLAFSNTEEYPEYVLLGIKKERNFRNTYDLSKGDFVGFKKDPEVLYLALKSNSEVLAHGINMEEIDRLVERDRKKIDIKIKEFLKEEPEKNSLVGSKEPPKAEILPSLLNNFDEIFFKYWRYLDEILLVLCIVNIILMGLIKKAEFSLLLIAFQVSAVYFPHFYFKNRVSTVFCRELNYESSECLAKQVSPLREESQDRPVSLVLSRESLLPDVFILEKNSFGEKKIQKMEKLSFYMSNEWEDSPVNLFVSKKKLVKDMAEQWFSRSESLEKKRLSPILKEVSKK